MKDLVQCLAPRTMPFNVNYQVNELKRQYLEKSTEYFQALFFPFGERTLKALMWGTEKTELLARIIPVVIILKSLAIKDFF